MFIITRHCPKCFFFLLMWKVHIPKTMMFGSRYYSKALSLCIKFFQTQNLPVAHLSNMSPYYSEANYFGPTLGPYQRLQPLALNFNLSINYHLSMFLVY